MRLFLSVCAKILGLGLMIFSIHYGIYHEAVSVHAGIVHFPSFVLVVSGLLGIALTSYQLETLLQIFRNELLSSPTLIRKKIKQTDVLLPELTEIYYQKGPNAFLKIMTEKKMSPLWQFIAIKLEARVPIADIQMLLQNQGKHYNEEIFTQIRALQSIATIAPAVGMTGTILGLIKMLKDLQDFSSLGGNMALAFITALYGLILGNFVFIPLVNRLNAAREETMRSIGQGLFWLEMISKKKPAHYLDADDCKRITA